MIEALEKQLKEMHAEKVKNEHWEHHCREIRGDNIYLDFCLWCNCQGDTDDKLRNNEKVFAEWLKRENCTLTEYQRRWIAENHFGWRFTWNEEKKEWESKKNGK